MNSLYHSRGILRAVAVPIWRHIKRCASDPAYRALHRFDRQLRAVPRFTRSTVSFEGRPIQICDSPSFLSAWDEIFINRIYDVGELPECPRLIDAGANIGLAALYWRRRYGAIRYIGFEPDPTIAAICRTNLVAWGVHGTLIEAAVGPQAGEANFVGDGADGGRICDVPRGGIPQAIVVRVENLQDHLNAPVDLLKIDIEGAEAALLPSLESAVRQVRRFFVVWHCPPTGPSGVGDAIGMLERWGFSVYVQNVSWPEQMFAVAAEAKNFRQQLNLYAVRS
jgi:FkbM family methyltransferase